MDQDGEDGPEDGQKGRCAGKELVFVFVFVLALFCFVLFACLVGLVFCYGREVARQWCFFVALVCSWYSY